MMTGDGIGVGIMADSVSVLRVQDRVDQDVAMVAVIYRDMGKQAADQVVIRAMDEVALTMAGLVGRVQSRELSDVARQLRRLQRLSVPLGLVSLAQVAQDARGCLEAGDVTAFSAVWARLVRVAKRSLVADRTAADQWV